MKLLLRFSSLLSISKPRMVKVSDHAIPSSGQMMSLGLFLTPTGMMWVLSRLHARPDIWWKAVMYFVAYFRLLGHLFIKSVVSSAKASARAPLSADVTPVMFLVFVILINNTSTINKNK